MYPSPVRPAASTEEAIEPSSVSCQSLEPPIDRFVTPPLQVYIEDTDAYGVMYNGHYLRAYDRALHMMLVPSPSSSSSVVEDRDDWSIVSVEELKFKSPPPLGGTYCIEGTRRPRPASSSSNDTSFADDWGNGTFVVETSPTLSLDTTIPRSSTNGNTSREKEVVWDMIMRSPDGSTVYNAATGVTMARSPSPPQVQARSTSSRDVADDSYQDDWLPSPPPLFLANGSTSTTASTTTSLDTFRTYRDEFDPHLDSHVPLRIALNYMERSRTNCIGGPSVLHELQTTYGVLYVVTAVRNCSLVSFRINRASGEGANRIQGRPPHEPRLVPGMQVDVETTFRARKRGAVIDCYHTLVLEDAGASIERHRIAQGVVTIMALDATTRRPTNKLPSWLMSRFDVPDPAA